MKITIDFETRSAVPIKRSGSWRYALDSSTQIMCLAWKVEDSAPKVWLPDWIIQEYDLELGGLLTDDPTELQNFIKSGAIIEAHNAFFERSIWRNIMVPKYKWPDIKNENWRCSAAKCAAHSLPRALGDAARVMNLDVQKDVEGKKMIQRLCKPKKPSKADSRNYWGSKEEMERFFLYCARDVDTEYAVSEKLPDLSPFEQQVWFIDQEINETGIYYDKALAEKIIGMVSKVKDKLRLQTYDLTDGAVLKPTSRNQLLAWLEEQNYPLPNTQGETVDRCFEDPNIPDHVYRVLKNTRQCGRSSTAKFTSMQNRHDPRDDRIRDTLMYWGANTGRFSGKGTQFQNLPRGSIKDMDAACDVISNNDMDGIQAALDEEALLHKTIGKGAMTFLSNETDLMEFFSSTIRGMIKAPEGKALIVVDYSSIEARGVAWAANDKDALDIFWAGEDIYCDMASAIFSRKITKADSEERQLGKRAILGLGYGMGAKKFLETCRKYNNIFNVKEMMPLIPMIDQGLIEMKILKNPLIYFDKAVIIEEDIPHLVIAKFIVDRYREKYIDIVNFWQEVEWAAHNAVTQYQLGAKKRKWIKAGSVMFKVVGSFLFCRLPSGRRLAYPYPYMRDKLTLWEELKNTLHYKGVDSLSKKWCVQTTYGGKLVENIVQAIARDIMVHAMVKVRKDDNFKIVLTVHDELVTEYDLETGLSNPVKSLENLMSITPEWAEGFPIAAEGWMGQRYKK